jgi:hypothetical protein
VQQAIDRSILSLEANGETTSIENISAFAL